MPHTVIKLARGTTTQCNAYAGPAGELIVDTTAGTIVVQNAAAGGVRLARLSDLQSLDVEAPDLGLLDVYNNTVNADDEDLGLDDLYNP